MVLYSVVDMKSSCVKNENTELYEDVQSPPILILDNPPNT